MPGLIYVPDTLMYMRKGAHGAEGVYGAEPLIFYLQDHCHFDAGRSYKSLGHDVRDYIAPRNIRFITIPYWYTLGPTALSSAYVARHPHMFSYFSIVSRRC